jgi:hypothetical protein
MHYRSRVTSLQKMIDLLLPIRKKFGLFYGMQVGFKTFQFLVRPIQRFNPPITLSSQLRRSWNNTAQGNSPWEFGFPKTAVALKGQPNLPDAHAEK